MTKCKLALCVILAALVFPGAASASTSIVSGLVNGDGTIAGGTGFTVTQPSGVGRYTVTFATAFANPPAVVATLHVGITQQNQTIQIASVAAGNFVVYTALDNCSGCGRNFTNYAFSFIATSVGVQTIYTQSENDTRYSLNGHNHDSSYAALSHHHNSAYCLKDGTETDPDCAAGAGVSQTEFDDYVLASHTCGDPNADPPQPACEVDAAPNGTLDKQLTLAWAGAWVIVGVCLAILFANLWHRTWRFWQ